MYKYVTIFFTCQLALALAAPAVEQRTVTTNNLVENSGGQRDVQKLLDELERNQATQQNLIQKTTTTTTIEESQPALSETETAQLEELMKDPNFVKELKQLLVQFLNMYNSMNNMGPTSTKVISEENVDIEALLRNPSFFSFVSNFFNAQNQGGFLTQLFNLQQPSVSKTTTTEIIDNGDNTGANAAEALLQELSSSVVTAPGNQDRNKVVTTIVEEEGSKPSVANRYNENSQVTITKVPTAGGQQVTEDWSKVPSRDIENTAEFRQQAKNAKFEFATQVDDKINGNFQQRAEIRQGGVVYGKSSYDDGYFWRTNYYVADKDGYRITKEDVRPSKMTQLTGEANVQTLLDGNLVTYHITENDIGNTRRGKNNMML